MALVKCKECGKEVSNKAKTCPGCGAKINAAGFSVIKAIGLAVACGIGVLYFIGNNGTGGSAASTSQATSALAATDVAFAKGQFGNRIVTGKVVNTTGKKRSYVQVEVNLFDRAGTQVGSTLANVNNLEPGVTWDFQAPILEDRAVSAKIAGVTSF